MYKSQSRAHAEARRSRAIGTYTFIHSTYQYRFGRRLSSREREAQYQLSSPCTRRLKSRDFTRATGTFAPFSAIGNVLWRRMKCSWKRLFGGIRMAKAMDLPIMVCKARAREMPGDFFRKVPIARLFVKFLRKKSSGFFRALALIILLATLFTFFWGFFWGTLSQKFYFGLWHWPANGCRKPTADDEPYERRSRVLGLERRMRRSYP